ncbi:MAG: hypothetical protein HYV09_00505 [Deltaproteobacteria bacterium]|nr:hypothetical protein [Deltaproteobacteria bacterium]
MLERFGLRVRYGEWLTVDSELMANGGPALHGTSAYEGQAALQIRQQVLRLATGSLFGEVGRLIDEASVDFLSRHVGDAFLQDTATRDPLLYSGFNLGNGVRGGVRIGKLVRAGLTLNAGNPVSTTGSLMVGGTFSPFDRFYVQPYQAIGKGPNNYPDDSFHMMMATPWLLIDSKIAEVRLAFQRYVVDTDMTRRTDENIHGYNARAGFRLNLFDRVVSPFANVSLNRNDTVLATDLSKRAAEKYTAVTSGGGIDFNVSRRFQSDVADGFGVQYVHIQHQVGGGAVTRLHYVNVGGTFWLGERVAAGARFAFWVQKQPATPDAGERSVFLTLRYVM